MMQHDKLWNNYAILRSFGNSKIIQILFLKSIIDDASRYKNLNVENMKVFFDFQRLFNDNELTEKELYRTFIAVEQANNLKNNELTSGISLFRFYFERENQKKINEILKEFELTPSFEERKKLFLDILTLTAMYSDRYSSESISSPSLYRLGTTLLNINENDRILNTFAGNSAFILNQNNFKEAYGYEINVETLAITYMLKIMCGIENYEVELKDFYLNENSKHKFDKIFTDGPLSMRLKGDYESIDSNILNIKKTYDLLDDNGVAVISVPDKVLFAGTKQYRDLRKSLSNIGLKSIVILPNNVLYGTMIPINLFVIQKGYNGKVLIVNTSEEMFYSTKLLKEIKDEALDTISKTIENNKVIDGYSYEIDAKELFGEGNDPVTLQKFFVKIEKTVHRTIDIIDDDISKIIKELINLNK